MQDSKRLRLCVQFLWELYFYTLSEKCSLSSEKVNEITEAALEPLGWSEEERQNALGYLMALAQKTLKRKDLRRLWSDIEGYNPKDNDKLFEALKRLPPISEAMRELEVSEKLFMGFLISCLKHQEENTDLVQTIMGEAIHFATMEECTNEEVKKVCDPIIKLCKELKDEERGEKKL